MKRNCPFCSRQKIKQVKNYKLLYKDAHSHIVRCQNCGLIFDDKALFVEANEKEIYQTEVHYDPKTIGAREKKRIPLKQHLFRKVSRLIPKGRILDFGCSTGDLLDHFKARGYETFGVEISKFATSRARKKGHKIFCGPVDKAPFLDNYFDAINMSDVFVHLENPLEKLDAIYKWLKPGGYFFMNEANYTHFKLITFLKFRVFGAGPGLYRYCLNFLDKDSWQKLTSLLKFSFLGLEKLGYSSDVFVKYMSKTVLNKNRALTWLIVIFSFLKIDQRFNLERLYLATYKK